MKKDIHPQFRDVIFHDVSCDFKYKTLSTINTKHTIEHEGAEYPLVKIDISSASHPFFTGKQRIADSEGRSEKFAKKFGNRFRRQNRDE